jgi:hypothetical protein
MDYFFLVALVAKYKKYSFGPLGLIVLSLSRELLLTCESWKGK